MRKVISAAAVLVLLGTAPAAQQQEGRQADVDLQAAIRTETVEGDLARAIQQYKAIATTHRAARGVAAMALVRMADCHRKLGDAQAKQIYQQVVTEYGDQAEAVKLAREALRATPAARSAGPAYRRVWDGSNVDATGGVSADGRWLSFVDWVTGDLAIRDLQAGTERRLTNKGSWVQSDQFALHSVPSKDGRRVAYAWFNGTRFELRVTDTGQAGEPRRLLDRQDIASIVPFEWSRDGKRLVLSTSDLSGETELAILSIDTGVLGSLARLGPAGTTRAAFSPGGDYVVYDRVVGGEGDEGRELFVTSADGAMETTVAPNPGRDAVVGWSPDGEQVLFASERSGTWALWSQRVSEGRPVGSAELLKTDIGQPLGITDAGQLFVAVATGGRDVRVVDVDFTTGTVKGLSKPATVSVGTNGQPAWSPDGKSLSYVFTRVGRPVVAIKDLSSGRVREVYPNLRELQRTSWMPNGLALVTRGIDPAGRSGIYTIDPKTGQVSAMVTAVAGDAVGLPALSPDGARLYFTRRRGPAGRTTIVERTLASGTERELLSSVTMFGLSPDGASIAAIRFDETARRTYVVIQPVSGGAPREVLSASPPMLLNAVPAWSRDGRYVTVGRVDSIADRREILAVPADGGAPRVLDLGGVGVSDIRVHPDGRQLAYTGGASRTEVWVFEQFTRR